MIANASDSLSETNPGDVSTPEIHVWSESNRQLIVPDNGKGMIESEIRNHLLTLFATSKENKEDLVGRFGIGFYSCFALSETVEVQSKAREPDSIGMVAVYSGGQSVALHKSSEVTHGTVIRSWRSPSCKR